MPTPDARFRGTRVHDAPLSALVDVILKMGRIVIPGVITHASNIVEHPEWIAERIMRYAERVGRENVIAGTDRGFSSQATYTPEVYSTVMWAKVQAMTEGARLASQQLWP